MQHPYDDQLHRSLYDHTRDRGVEARERMRFYDHNRVEAFIIWHTDADGSTRIDHLRCTLREARRAACEDYPDAKSVKLTRNDRNLTPVTI
jgi:hypothetical protein